MAVEPSVVRDRTPSGGARRAADGVDSAPPSVAEPADALVAHSIEELDRCEWDSLFRDELENWNYLRALERSELEHCDPMYFAIRSRGRLVAAAPGFLGRRVLGEPWRGSSRTRWRRARERTLVLGSPLSATFPVGLAARATAAEQASLVKSMARAVRAEAARLRVDRVLVSGEHAARGESPRRFGPSLWRPRARRGTTVRLSLPPWSFSDYLSCLDEPLRGQVLRVCAQAAPYGRDWHVDLDRDVRPMLALCREDGLDELNSAYFENLLGPGVCASCLLVRLDGKLAGFSLLLHDARASREKLTIVSRRLKGAPVRALIWLETIRFCLEAGIGTYESASELSLAAVRPD